MAEYRVAVINHSWLSSSMAGWGWSLGEANVPRQFKTRDKADALANKLDEQSLALTGAWNFQVIEGPPFVLPEPRNPFHEKRKELPRSRNRPQQEKHDAD